MKEELKKLLLNVPNSYDDFVEYILLLCDTEERVREMTDFILTSENISTSSVLRFSDKYDAPND